MCVRGFGQIIDPTKIFNQLYPVSDNPNINWKSNMAEAKKYETILFEANPTVRFSFFNNIYPKLYTNKNYGQAYYVSYRPELRMYTDNSVPVKMPSYRILLGMQHIWRVRKKNLFAVSLESGHYSNGQDGSTFSKYPDASKSSDSVIATINSKSDLSKMLNRENGEFSTDLTELILNYRINILDGDNTPKTMISFKAGGTYFHDKFLFLLPFGGYADNLIDIYGHWRFMSAYSCTMVVGKRGNSVGFSENIEYIYGAHPWIDPWRTESTVSFFFNNDFGFFGSYIYGHDNYNIRFVDHGSQVSFGVCWNMFPAFKLKFP